MSLLSKFKIEDKNTEQAFKAIEKLAQQGIAGNFEKRDSLTQRDASTLKDGVRYIDEKNNRIVFKINGKLMGADLSEIS